MGSSGIDGYLIQVEMDVSSGLPRFSMAGALASGVREAQDRVRTALRNCEYQFPSRKVTASLSPVDVREEGIGSDFPIVVGALAAFGVVGTRGLWGMVLTGGLGLDDNLKSIRGTLFIVLAVGDAGLKCCFLPERNVIRDRAIPGIEIVEVKDIREMVRLLDRPRTIRGEGYLSPNLLEEEEESYGISYADVNGQLLPRQATETAVSGRYNIPYIGPVGTGKTTVAQHVPTIIPALSVEERLETSRVYSTCGMLPQSASLINRRPFRNPHHSISLFALIRGGSNPKPGEISLAFRDVLFLDEFPEFRKRTIEILYQPPEEYVIIVFRVKGGYQFPTDFMSATAMNPCNCGHYPDRNRCRCTDAQIRRYLGKISEPILDRIDIRVEAAPLQYEELRVPGRNEDSKTIGERMERVRRIQEERFEQESIYSNGEISGTDTWKYCRLPSKDESFFKRLYQIMGLSVRAYDRTLKMARTVTDMDGNGDIAHEYLYEAIGYRNLEEKCWNTGGST